MIQIRNPTLFRSRCHFYRFFFRAPLGNLDERSCCRSPRRRGLTARLLQRSGKANCRHFLDRAEGMEWACSTCTFLNLRSAAHRYCEMCGTPSSIAEDLVEDPSSSIGSIFVPLRRCSAVEDLQGGASKKPRIDDALSESVDKAKAVPVDNDKGSDSENANDSVNPNILKILSYNVWFREEMEVLKRMEAVGTLIEQHSPDFICFQEVTPTIYEIFQKADWWKDYTCSLSPDMALERPYFCMQMSRATVKKFFCKPFHNSIMGRELCVADVSDGRGKRLILATSHLESPCPAPPKWNQMYSPERVIQAKESLSLLDQTPNAIFCGDMNWDDKLDGPFPLPRGWVDPWVELRPKESGWTFDTKANQMLSANRTLQKRLDRFACKLQDFTISSIEMIGQEAIPGISYVKEKVIKKKRQELMLPILPSDHFGLVLMLQSL